MLFTNSMNLFQPPILIEKIFIQQRSSNLSLYLMKKKLMVVPMVPIKEYPIYLCPVVHFFLLLLKLACKILYLLSLLSTKCISANRMKLYFSSEWFQKPLIH